MRCIAGEFDLPFPDHSILRLELKRSDLHSCGAVFCYECGRSIHRCYCDGSAWELTTPGGAMREAPRDEDDDDDEYYERETYARVDGHHQWDLVEGKLRYGPFLEEEYSKGYDLYHLSLVHRPNA